MKKLTGYLKEKAQGTPFSVLVPTSSHWWHSSPIYVILNVKFASSNFEKDQPTTFIVHIQINLPSHCQ